MLKLVTWILPCVALTVAIIGCTNAERAKFGAYGNNTVIMYSGGKEIRRWESIGYVLNEHESDGFFFRDKETNKLIRVSGDVVIESD